jgi:16S rRNA (cytosine967-C5)-methyltransferase
VEPWLKDALRLGVYQLALLTHVPAHAAIYETVELAKAFGRPGGGGFLNGVLRSASALVTPEVAAQPAADALPLEAGQYRKLARPVLPDPGTNSVEYLAAGFAWPRWLADRWLQRFGWEECLRLGFWFAGPGPLWLRINPLRTNREAYLAGLREAGVEAAAGEHPQAIRLAHHVAVRELPGYDKGWFTVQDESAMRVGSALSPQPGSRVLDLCAAPGGKTTHLAELMQNQGEIIACDIVNRRLETLAELARRLGLSMIQTRRLDTKQDGEPPAGPFDAILVDAPCSNTGVLGRRPEARWRLRSGDFRRLVPLQTKLLLQASERIRPGCAIVYATCSIEPEENRQVVQAVLSGNTGLELEAEDESRPGRPADGGYWARLRRRS